MACLAILLLLLHPHDSAPTLWLNADVTQDEVELTVCVRADHAGPWLFEAMDPADLVDMITDEEFKLAAKTLEKYFGKHNPVRINDVRVKPKVRAIETPETQEGEKMIEFLAIRFVYPCDGWPKKLQIEWEDFEGAVFQKETVVPGTLQVGPQFESMALVPSQPKFTWAYPESGLPDKRILSSIPAPAAASVDWRPHMGLGALVLLALVFVRRLWMWGVVIAITAGGAFALPWKADESPVLTVKEARDVFETLLHNVYSAFDAITEEDEYDLLALSVDEPLVEPLYLEIRKGLVMQRQGGAVAEVGNIERRGGEIKFTGARTFDVRWRWQVFAHVTHWGHTHSRINEYLANFRVHATDDGWRISKYEVLDLTRIKVPDENEAPK